MATEPLPDSYGNNPILQILPITCIKKKPQYVCINPILSQMFASKNVFTRVPFTAVMVYLIVHDGALFGNDKYFN